MNIELHLATLFARGEHQMTRRPEQDVPSAWADMASEAIPDPAAARRRARMAGAARRARIRYHARWIMINLVLIGVSAWLYVNVLIPRFITKELTAQSAELVNADYDGSAPDTAPASRRTRTAPASFDRRRISPSRSARESPPVPRPAYANAAMLEELDAQCVDKRVFRKTVTNGVTEITEVTGLRC